MRITILGCGSSGGVPLVGCTCAVCTSDNPKNKRLRVSVLVETQGKNILVDASPDLRQQALTNQLKRVDAVLFTHDHADHTHGIDELRSFNYLSGDSIPIYGDAKTMAEITNRFSYAFQPKPSNAWYRPSLLPNVLPDAPVFDAEVLGIPVRGFVQGHGYTTSLGFRIGDVAYSTDVKTLSDEALDALAGVKLWVVDCLRRTESPGHSTLENTLAWIARVKPERAILTHMAHDLDYEALKKELPPRVEPAYDGLVLEVR